MKLKAAAWHPKIQGLKKSLSLCHSELGLNGNFFPSLNKLCHLKSKCKKMASFIL